MGLFGSEMTIDLAVEEREFIAGEEIAARVTVGGERDKRVQAGRIELVYKNGYVYERSDPDGPDENVATSKTVTVATEPLPSGSGAAVAPGTHFVTLRLPPDAPPTALEATGRVREPVKWEVRAILDRRMAVDPDSTVPVVVRSRPDQYAAWAQQAPVSGHECDMTLELSTRALRVGETVSGVLGIAAKSEFEGRGVRVQLKRKRVDTPDNEIATYTDPKAQLAGETRFAPRDARRYPFELTVPPDVAPSFVAMYNHHHLYVEGVIDRSMAGDYTVEAELNVYSGPERSAGAPAADAPPAGWYPDPWQQAPQRFWDGSQWTGHTHE
jgi:hypothetical protein